MSIWEQLTGYLSFSFVRYALIAGVLIALCSSLLGVTLVLKRFSVIGDGLSHVAFGALAIATVLRLSNNMLLVMPVTVVCAVILLCANQNAKIKGDAAIAMLSVSALAIGYLIQNLFSSSANISGDVCSTLFGSTLILTLSKSDVWLCVGMSVVVMAIFLLFYHKIFAVTFDETFAAATGCRHVQPADRSSHGSHHCPCHESGRFSADFRTDRFSGTVRHAAVPEFSRRDFLCSGDLRRLCCSGTADLDTGFHAGGGNHCHCRSGSISGLLRHRGSAPEKIKETAIKQKRLTEKVSRFFV